MAATILSNSSPPWKTGNRTVTTFPSGLVALSQEYVVPTADVEDYHDTFAIGSALAVSSPAIDGLYVFPNPSWQDNSNGLSSAQVTAYGRANETGRKTKRVEVGEVSVGLAPLTKQYDVISVEFVREVGSDDLPSVFGEEFTLYDETTGAVEYYTVPGSGVRIKYYASAWTTRIVRSTNFGEFEEVVVDFAPSSFTY